MWIQVRADNLNTVRVDGLSKMTKIAKLKEMLVDSFKAPVERQRLFFRGKQLENDYSLFDYDVGLNNVIQILIKPEFNDEKSREDKNKENHEVNGQDPSSGDDTASDEKPASVKKDDLGSDSNNSSSVTCNGKTAEYHSEEEDGAIKQSMYFKVGEMVNARDLEHGAWFEAKIVDIRKKEEDDKSPSATDISKEDSLVYLVEYANYDNDRELLPLENIRPLFKRLNFDEVKIGDVVLANYNIEEPKEVGFWYECKITGKKEARRGKELKGDIYVGSEKVPISDCSVKFPDEVYLMTENVPLAERESNANAEEALRKIQPSCSHCKDVPTKKCKFCSCNICGGKDEPEKQIMCDECDLAYHIGCLTPPLTEIPDSEEWYCPSCKNDENEVVKAGEKLKESKKKAKMASASSNTKRDWGKGMATVGRTTVCTIVPPNHFGPIPGIEVGMAWKFRLQASESGVHRPHVAGIHGREQEGAFSIVLAGGYEDDLDNGDEFFYTGSGGRDLSGNKRTAAQSCNQTLTHMNKALALNCAAKLNPKGAEATNWKDGKPVRVLRSAKGYKHSKYCPKIGIRYDGLYKVVKYWSEVGKSGFSVWRFLLRRDDPTPAPYTEAGKKRMKKLGLTVQYPEGYAGAKDEEEDESEEEKPKTKKAKRSLKNSVKNEEETPAKKRKKSVKYSIPTDVAELIAKDEKNSKLWEECKTYVTEGSLKFIQEVENQFMCICCQDIVVEPITTDCCHNICKACLKRSFKAEVFCCPMCRHELSSDYVMNVNTVLKEILLKLFPGYTKGR